VQHTQCLSDATGKSLLAHPIADRFAHLTVLGTASPQEFKATVCKTFDKGGLDCRMIETPDFARFLLPTTEEIGKVTTDSITHDLITDHGK
jgi:hypothetical protein